MRKLLMSVIVGLLLVSGIGAFAFAATAPER